MKNRYTFILMGILVMSIILTILLSSIPIIRNKLASSNPLNGYKNIKDAINGISLEEGNLSEGELEGTLFSGPGCTDKEISYSIIKISENTSENEFIEDICISKTVECSLAIENLDDLEAGVFEIEFVLINNDKIDSEIVSQSIEAKEEKSFKKTFNIQSQGQEGYANQELSCSYNLISIPTKQVC